RRLTAWKDDAVDLGELGGATHGHGSRAGSLERGEMLAHVALESEHADRQSRCHERESYAPRTSDLGRDQAAATSIASAHEQLPASRADALRGWPGSSRGPGLERPCDRDRVR